MKNQGRAEDVRISNAAFTQTKIGEYTTMILSSVGIASSIVAAEMGFVNKKGNKDNDIRICLYICMLSSFLMCFSIMINYQLLIKWQRSKNIIIETDNLINTGLYKKMIVECLCTLIHPFPWLMGITYSEEHMYGDTEETFELNNMFICFMFFFRIYFYARSLLSLSMYT